MEMVDILADGVDTRQPQNHLPATFLISEMIKFVLLKPLLIEYSFTCS